MRVILAGIIGGILLFIWGAISWMVLPWHNTTINRWANEQVIAETITTNTPNSGVYFLPFPETTATATATPTPMVFAAITKERSSQSIIGQMIVSLLTQIVAACIVAWMLFRTSNLGFFSCVSFVTVFGIAAGLVSHIPYLNWFGFDLHFTAVQLADLVIGWYFAGLGIAWVYRSDKNTR